VAVQKNANISASTHRWIMLQQICSPKRRGLLAPALKDDEIAFYDARAARTYDLQMRR
jgi:hypothetical protein